MNKIFRIVFNAATGRYVVASEMAKGRTKASGATAQAVLFATLLGAGVGVASAGSVDGGSATNSNDVAVGSSSVASGGSSTAVGTSSKATAQDGTAIGQLTTASGVNSTAIGNQVEAAGAGSIAIGGDTRVTNNANSITTLQSTVNNMAAGALVQQASAGAALTVGKNTDGASVDFTGTAGTRKLVGVSDGAVTSASKEAVNGSQLYATEQKVAANTSAISALDSRTTKNEGDIASIDNRTTKNEGDITSLDQRQTKTEGDVASLDQRQTKTEGDVSDLRQGVNGLDGRVSTVETNVAGLNEKLAKTGTEVINQSRAYTDKRVEELHSEMDDRFNVQDERIDRMGAMSSAMSMMTASLGGLHTQNRAAVGTGFVNGEKALSVGYQRGMSDRANFSLGGAFTSDDRSVGAAVGIGW